MPSTSSHDFDSLDQRIDALCTRLGSDDAAGATDFANRNGSSDESRAWFAAIWIVTKRCLAGEDGREENAIADSLAVML